MRDVHFNPAPIDERERCEADLFDALGATLRLPSGDALSITGFAAGLMAAHLADVAAMETREDAVAAHRALRRLHDETSDLLLSLTETGRGAGAKLGGHAA